MVFSNEAIDSGLEIDERMEDVILEPPPVSFAQKPSTALSHELEDGHVEAIVAERGKAAFTRLDVTNLGTWNAAVALTVATFGKLNTLVNNAGIFHPGGVEAETEEGWARMIGINQTGVFYGIKTAAPELLKAGNAAIVNISSLYRLIGSPDALSYHASKAAVRVMGKGAALEFAKKSIRVNTIFPGQILTPILGDITAEQDAATGHEFWYANLIHDCAGKEFCDLGISAAVTAIPGVVFAGHLDGMFRAYDSATGAVLWQVDTTRPVRTIDGRTGKGGSMSGSGPAVWKGRVFVNSGYGFYSHIAGNVLLVYGAKIQARH